MQQVGRSGDEPGEMGRGLAGVLGGVPLTALARPSTGLCLFCKPSPAIPVRAPGHLGLQSWNTEPLRHKESIPSTGPLEPFIPDLESCTLFCARVDFDSASRAEATDPTVVHTPSQPPPDRWPTLAPAPALDSNHRHRGFDDAASPTGARPLSLFHSQWRPPIQNYSDSWTSWTESSRSVPSLSLNPTTPPPSLLRPSADLSRLFRRETLHTRGT
jgi:hypothetical protein